MPCTSARACRVVAVLTLGLCAAVSAAAGPATRPAGPFVRVSLLSPTSRPWRVHVIAEREGSKPTSVYAGRAIADSAKAADLLPGGQSTTWIDLTPPGPRPADTTIRFRFETQQPDGKVGKDLVEAKIDLATAADDAAILRTLTDHDPGGVLAIRMPADPAEEKLRILSIREDARRRLDEVKSFNLPDGPRPRKIWTMTGFRSNDQFYTDPAIAAVDMETIRRLGMNGYWEQNGGQPGGLREIARNNGMNRSTVYWRCVESMLPDKELGGATRLDWTAIDRHLDALYRAAVDGTRRAHPDGVPEIIADLMDEPDGLKFDGPEYVEAFRSYTMEHGQTPASFGKSAWAEVSPIPFRWRAFFTTRAALDLNGEPARRLFYWSLRFWNYSTARTYALATAKVERYAPGVMTRVNFGPPWVYDYGTQPRGIDAFEFGRLRGVSMGFNEDWVGTGSRRVPLETNALLMDWSRAAARPNEPPLGAYITRDADRTSVKLRTFACLAREAKVFDFYYYGPAYTHFDPWSDNASMVRGVAELTRDIGAVDDLLYEGRAPRAQVAILYSSSWPVWKTDDTEQFEQVMAYVALLHAGVPADIVSDAEVADGRFAARGYKAMYVVNESIPAAAASVIQQWVRTGGQLWASGWAGMRDEYNTPTAAWDEMLGVKARSWKSTGDEKRMGKVLEPADWLRPIFGRDVRLELNDAATTRRVDPATQPTEPAVAAATTAPAVQPIDLTAPTAAAYRRSHGKGLVQVVPWAAGKAYMDAATTKDGGPLGRATLFPSDDRRAIFTGLALEAGATAPATTSADQVLAWPLWSQRGGVVLLANYTGNAVTDDVRVSFIAPTPVTKVRSLRHGDRSVTRAGDHRIEVTLPMDDVTDILVIE